VQYCSRSSWHQSSSIATQEQRNTINKKYKINERDNSYAAAAAAADPSKSKAYGLNKERVRMFNGYNPSRGGGPGGPTSSGSSSSSQPRGYVAGRGRGAAGFQTRSDLGNTGNTASGSAGGAGGPPGDSPWGAAPTGYVAGAGRGASKMGAGTGVIPSSGPGEGGNEGGGEGNQTQQNQQQRNNNNNNNNNNNRGRPPPPSRPPPSHQQKREIEGQYDDPDDHEADLIWAAIDESMQNRRKRPKTKEGPEHVDDPRKRERLKIQHQFRDCKSDLANVSEEAWMNIPDAVGDHSLKFKRALEKKKNDIYTPLSDSMIESRMGDVANDSKNGIALNASVNYDDDDDDGTRTNAVNMSGIGAARGTVLGMSLDKMSEDRNNNQNQNNGTASGLKTSVVDASGYLTSMSTLGAGGGGQPGALPNNLGDIHKARLLLKSVRDTNPKHGPGWIASARVEEAAGKTFKARKIIQEGCEICGSNFVDVWLEAARLHPIKVAKSILATGVRRLKNDNNSTSTSNIPLFLKAAELENTSSAKKAVLRKALESNPHSLELWKYAIGLEESKEQAILLLGVAVEKVPSALELWLALARLETYENAQSVLNKARKALPSEKSIWIAASKLEESQFHITRISKIIDKAFNSLGKQDGVQISRKQWLEEAQECELSGAPRTAEAIITRSIGLGILNEDRLRTWSNDAKHVLQNTNSTSNSSPSIITARAILAHALKQFPTKRSLWMQAIDLEKTYGTNANANTNSNSNSGNVVGDSDGDGDGVKNNAEKDGGVTAMDTTTTTTDDDEKKDESPNNTDVANTNSNHNNNKYTLNIELDEVLQAASERLPKVEVFWLLRAKEQWLAGEVDKAREILQKAFEMNPSSERVWLAASKLEWSNDEIVRARLLLERARDRAPSYRVYMKSSMLEREVGNYDKSIQLIVDGIEKYPTTASKLYMMGGQIYSEDLPKTLVAVPVSSETEFDTMKTALLKKKKSYLEKARKLYQEGIEKCTSDTSGNVILWILASRLEERAHTFLSLQDNDEAAEAETESDNNATNNAGGITKARSLLELARLKHSKNDQLWLEAIRLERRSNNLKLSDSLMARALQECPKSGLLLSESIRIAPKVEQKGKSTIAIKRNPESSLIICAVATLFASDGKAKNVAKARKWYERSILLDKDIGDSWAYYYNFECKYGTQVQQNTIKERCIKAEPKHGEIWQSVTKNISNKDKIIGESVGDALELVATGIKDRERQQQQKK
jgi:pre-mRNA-processing factor 6